ncbi:putative spinocerebellar ataxia type 10 protein domain containing protein [Lyophyllum shimeji]|uniref:Ataxin-10 homolog n=1 Tax=Lyophyllum shimeji TaxID=47721 RepID=A0A9P3PS26_LYOSH|nr:putative spinocerebellar ataxia type 10 protein domain containing protein [Lyophyllum shimeji]
MLENESQSQSLLSLWKSAGANFDIGARASIVSLVTTLEQISQILAQNTEARVNLGANASLWTDLRKLWRDLTRAQLTFWDVDDEESEGSSNREKDLRTVCGSLAKFTRNLVAGVPDNQVRAYENEPDIRRLLHYHTSWSAMEDTESVGVARILAQAVSNIVTTNEVLMSKLWDTYMNLPEDQVVLMTVDSLHPLIPNADHNAHQIGRWSPQESSVGAQAFDVGYDIMAEFIEQGLVPDLYNKFSIPDEIVTPHQTTLLKIVDSYLQSVQMNSTGPATAKTIKIHRKLSPMLAKCFLDLSAYARQAVERALRPPDQTTPSSIVEVPADEQSTPKPVHPGIPAELDVMLPKVCEALVLVTQCVVTITLEADQTKVDQNQDMTAEPDLKAFFNETRSPDDGGVVESLIDLLRLLDLFLPRINFGKPVSSSSPSAQGLPTPIREAAADPTGFQYLKRDLVRLLGILCHGVKAVQDLIRTCGGIPVVMNLCVIDERNPYLREHAIFTLSCLLKDNRENQAVVDAIKPSHEWDENGVLKGTT